MYIINKNIHTIIRGYRFNIEYIDNRMNYKAKLSQTNKRRLVQSHTTQH
jgi:hypothetical protein